MHLVCSLKNHFRHAGKRGGRGSLTKQAIYVLWTVESQQLSILGLQEHPRPCLHCLHYALGHPNDLATSDWVGIAHLAMLII